jgi:WhiB family redox-sensing transcriptional regulator
MSEAWRSNAYCKGKETEFFYPEIGTKGAADQVKQVKTICALCEVSVECLQTAIENNETFGIWGGLTPKERSRIRRQYSVLTKEIALVLVKSNVRK